MLDRPVKLVVTRDQGFTIATYRAETRHRIRLGAARDGKIAAYSHEVAGNCRRGTDDYVVGGNENARRDVWRARMCRPRSTSCKADRNTPGFMRSPPDVPYIYALEAAIDELADQLDIDPVELRRMNDTTRECRSTARPIRAAR